MQRCLGGSKLAQQKPRRLMKGFRDYRVLGFWGLGVWSLGLIGCRVYRVYRVYRV